MSNTVCMSKTSNFVSISYQY